MRTTNIHLSALATLFFISACLSPANAGSLPTNDQRLIEKAGIPIYSGAEFVNGNQEVGFGFATSKKPEEVRAWHKKQLSAWSLYSDYGTNEHAAPRNWPMLQSSF